MSIIDNNKLLAEFLGWHGKKINITASRPKGDGIELYLKEVTEYNGRLIEESLQFHTDWNWLMQVVEKIESIVWEELNDTSFNVTIGATSYCVIQDNNGGVIEIIGQGGTKIESVYKAVVELIKWYNNENSAEFDEEPKYICNSCHEHFPKEEMDFDVDDDQDLCKNCNYQSYNDAPYGDQTN